MDLPLCMSELITELHAGGFNNANPGRIRHGMTAGHISRPPIDGTRSYRFDQEHVEEIRKYLANVPAPGRHKKPAVAEQVAT